MQAGFIERINKTKVFKLCILTHLLFVSVFNIQVVI